MSGAARGESSEPSIAIGDDRLRVVFHWQTDRFAHTVEVFPDDTWIAVLRSIEGTPAEDWPASPPLQQVHREDRGREQVILAVGMAGRSHWSASVTFDPVGPSLDFDLACRVHETPVWLGSRYSAYEQLQVHPIEGQLQTETQTLQVIANSTTGILPATARWRFRLNPFPM